MQPQKNIFNESDNLRNIRSRYRYPIMAWMIILLWFSMTTIVFGDAGGRFPVPEMEDTPSITIEDEDAAATCAVDAGWPAGVGEVLSITLSSAAGGPSGDGQIIIYHPNDPIDDPEIYVFFSVDDNTTNTAPAQMDKLILMFDLSHDHEVADTSSFDACDDRGIRFNRDGSVDQVYGNITNVSIEGALSDANTCVSEYNSTGWVMEARLFPRDLGLSNFNDLMGVAVMVEDWNTGVAVRSRWPATTGAAPDTWANLVMRSPIDFVILIDQSGSMAGDKWESAKQAGNNFALILSELIDDDLNTEFSSLGISGGGDRMGLATFKATAGPCLEYDTSGCIEYDDIDTSSEVIALTPIPSNPGDFTGVLPAEPGSHVTPIANGVNATFGMFGGAANLSSPALADPIVNRTRVVSLLSDGMHNSPRYTMDFNSQGVDFDYLPLPNCLFNDLDSYVKINTIAVGTDATVDTDKLDNIKDCFSGSRLTNIYNITSASEAQLTAQLTKFFVETLFPYYRWNLISTMGEDFYLNAGERKLLLFAFWANKGDAVNGLSIRKPDGIPGEATVANGGCDTSLGYCYLFLEDPDEGSYTDFNAPGAMADGKYVLLDLRAEARFAIDNQPHGTNSTITLRAKLRDAGEPILGADVRVDVARPEEGFGTYVSTHSLDNCKTQSPQLPPIDYVMKEWALKATTAGMTAKIDVSHAVAVQHDFDEPTSKIVLMAKLLEVCGDTGLDRTQDNGLKLYDNGTHGDEQPDDGLYTLEFENTQYEGSYVFRFRANATTTDGQNIQRVKEIAEYIRIDVDANMSDFDFRIIAQVDNLITMEYYVLPKDSKVEYLGPGYAHQIDFLTDGGQWISPVIDYNNGYYSRILQYDVTQGVPEVTAVVQGKPIKVSLRPFEIVPFTGYTFFDNSLNLDDGVVVGARFGYRFTNRLTLELEGGVTFTESTGGDSGNVIQALLNARYDVYSLNTGLGQLTPYVTAGAGGVFFRGFRNDDEAFAFQGGVGATLNLSNSFGIRVDSRVLQFSDAWNAGATTNFQVTGGLVFRF